MSKSLKNFVTIEEALEISTPRRLRILFLIQPWDGSFTYSDQSLEEARSKEKRFSEFIGNTKSMERELIRTWMKREIKAPSAAERKFTELLNAKKAQAHQSILNNFDTPGSMVALNEIVDGFYSYKEEAKEALAFPICLDAGRYVTRILQVFGVDFSSESGEGGTTTREELITPFVEDMVAFREEMKAIAAIISNVDAKVKVLNACDKLRDETIVERGVSLQDEGGKAVWKFRDPKEMKAEIAEAKRKALEEIEIKRANAIKKAHDDLNTLDSTIQTGDGSGMFRNAEFSEWDENGIPIKDATGQPVSKSRLGKIIKQRTSAAEKWERLNATVQKEGFASLEDYVQFRRDDFERIKRGEPLSSSSASGKKKTTAAPQSSFFTVNGDQFPTFIERLRGKNFTSVQEYSAFLSSS